MKMTVHENTSFVYLKTESLNDFYLIGRIASKFNKECTNANNDGIKELTLELKKVIEELAK